MIDWHYGIEHTARNDNKSAQNAAEDVQLPQNETAHRNVNDAQDCAKSPSHVQTGKITARGRQIKLPSHFKDFHVG